MAHFLISPRILLVKINLIFSALKKYIFQKENRPNFHMSNLPFQQDTQSVIASVGPSVVALALMSHQSAKPPTPEYTLTAALDMPGLLTGIILLILGHLIHWEVEKSKGSLHLANSLSLIVMSLFLHDTFSSQGIGMVMLITVSWNVFYLFNSFLS